MKYFFTTLFLAVTIFSFSQIVIDDFNDGDIKSWSKSSTIEISNENNELKVVCNEIGGPGVYNLFFMTFNHLDMSKFRNISMKVRVPDTSAVAPILRVEVRDINGYDSNRNPALLSNVTKGENGETYVMNFQHRMLQSYPSAILDPSDIVGFRIYINANTANAYTGTFYIDDIVLEGAQDPEIIPFSSEFVFNINHEVGWSDTNYNDTSWETITAPIAYNKSNVQSSLDSSLSGGNEISDLYLRKKFYVSDTAAFHSLVMNLHVDDAATIYLNGDTLYDYNSSRVSVTDIINELAVFPLSVLDTGFNVLAVHVKQSNDNQNDLFFDINLHGSRYEDGVTRGPYLQMNNESGVTIKWRTLSKQSSLVRYGLDVDNLTDSLFIDESVLDHVVTLSGLSSNTKYYYSVGNSERSLTEVNNLMYFQTHPAKGQVGNYNFWVIGDAGRSTADQRKIMKAYLDTKSSESTNGWLLLGDNAYNEGTDEEYQIAMFENMFEDMLINTCVFPTPGNHDLRDYGTVNQAIVNAPYFDIFELPTDGRSGGVASNTESYYSWDYGNAHFVSLDSYGTSLSTLDSMYKWLEKDLKANNQRWTVAYWHHPPHTKGSHDSDLDTDSYGIMSKIRQSMVPLLENYGVDLILTGHSHVYERSYLSHGFYGYSNNLVDGDYILYPQSDGNEVTYKKSVGVDVLSNKGTVYAVVGCSGSASEEVAWVNEPENYLTKDFFHESTNEHIGSFVLNINNDTLTGQFLDNEGVFYDEFHIVKDNTTPMRYAQGVGSTVIGDKIEIDWVNDLKQDSIIIMWTTDMPAESKIDIWIDEASKLSYYDADLKTIHMAKFPLLSTDDIYYAIAYNQYKYMISPEDKNSFDITVIGVGDDFVKQIDFNLYPVPTKEIVNVSFSLKSSERISLSLLNINGKVEKQLLNDKSVSAGKQNLSIPLGVKSGIYFLHLSIGDKDLLEKIIVE